MPTLMELYGGVKQTHDSQASRLINNHLGKAKPQWPSTPGQERTSLQDAQK